jgi:histone-lysine N-methyltransferase SETMAR
MATTLMRTRDRSIIQLSYLSGLSTIECFKYLDGLYPKDRPCQRTVDKTYKNLDEGTFTLADPIPLGRTFSAELVSRVLMSVTMNPFLSLRKIADKLLSNKDTVRDILITVLECRKRYTKWVPHFLNSEQKKKRVALAKETVKILEGERLSGFVNVVTGDESWILHSYHFRTFWGKKTDPRPEVPKTDIGTSKLMLLVFWGTDGIPVLEFLPEGETVRAKSFKIIVVDELLKVAKKLPKEKTLYVHWDNASSHTAGLITEAFKDSRITLIPQPHFSPDLAPSDFFLIRVPKESTQGHEVQQGQGTP